AHLPITGPVGLSPEQFLEHMAVDKKVLSGKLRLVLLQGLGEAVVTSDFDAALLPQVIASCSD
ncbi:MAG: 3-dehydroquinate synthase, partial [Halothiobacillaceae bacterium]